MIDDPFTAAAPRPSPVPPRPSRPAPAMPTPPLSPPAPASSARADKVLGGMQGGMLPPPPLEPAEAPAPSLTEQQMAALRQAFEAVLIRSGSIPPPKPHSIPVQAAKVGVDGTVMIFKSVGALVLVILPVLSQLFPKYFAVLWAIVSAMKAAP